MPSTQTATLTPGQARTLKARRAASRKAEDARAEFLRGRGWVCIPPEEVNETNDS